MKIRNLCWQFFLLQLLILCSIWSYNSSISIDYKGEESKRVSLLVRDLGVQISYYDKIRGQYGSYDPNTENSLDERQQQSYRYLEEGESARFNYSTSVFYEDWNAVNSHKLQVYNNLKNLLDNGETLYILEQKEVEESIPVIEWLIENDIDYIDKNKSNHSVFILYQSLPILMGVFSIAIICILFGDAIFRDLYTPQKNLIKLLPLPMRKIYKGKNMLFLSILGVFILSIGAISLISHFLFDEIPLSIQLNYPLTYFYEGTLINKPMWEFICYYVLIFIVISFLLCHIIMTINRYLNNYLISLLSVMFVVAVLNMSDALLGKFKVYNVFQTDVFIMSNSSYTMMFTVAIILAMGLILFKFNSNYNLKPTTAKIPVSKQYTIKSIAHFERIKSKKSNHLLYSFLLLILIACYHTLNMSNELLLNQQKVYTQLQSDIDLYKKALEQFDSSQIRKEEYDKMVNESNAYISLLEKSLEEIKEGNYSSIKEVELHNLKGLFDWYSKENAAFMSNVHINYQLAKWKENNAIDFVPPGGPYRTEFIGSFESLNKVREGEPISVISKEEYNNYINSLNHKHEYSSGLNSLHQFVTSYYFLIFFVILVLFFSTNYVEEWDKRNPTINMIRTQPIKLSEVFRIKRRISLFNILLLLTFTLILITVLGVVLNGVGHVNFPVIQYLTRKAGHSGMFNDAIKIPFINNYYRILPIWKVIVFEYLLLVALIVFVNELVYLLSRLINKKWYVVSLAITFIAGGYFLTRMLPGNILPYVPLSYLDIPSIVQGKAALLSNSQLLKWDTGIGVCILSAAIMRISDYKFIYGGKENVRSNKHQ